MSDLKINCIISTKNKTYCTYIENAGHVDLNETIHCKYAVILIERQDDRVSVERLPILVLNKSIDEKTYNYFVLHKIDPLVEKNDIVLSISGVKECAVLTTSVYDEYDKFLEG